jgi:hypothetical protein
MEGLESSVKYLRVESERPPSSLLIDLLNSSNYVFGTFKIDRRERDKAAKQDAAHNGFIIQFDPLSKQTRMTALYSTDDEAVEKASAYLANKGLTVVCKGKDLKDVQL